MGQQQPLFKVSLSRCLCVLFRRHSCAGSAPRPVPPIAHDSTTTAARKGANDSHNLESPRRSNSSYSTSPSPCRLAATSMPGREYRSFPTHVGRDTAGVNRRTPAARPQARSSCAGGSDNIHAFKSDRPEVVPNHHSTQSETAGKVESHRRRPSRTRRFSPSSWLAAAARHS